MKNHLELKELFPEFTETDIKISKMQAKMAIAIRQRRKELGLSQAELAEKAGVKQCMVSKWENLGYNFTIASLISVAQALDLNLDIRLEPITEDCGNNPFSQSMLN